MRLDLLVTFVRRYELLRYAVRFADDKVLYILYNFIDVVGTVRFRYGRRSMAYEPTNPVGQ
ncbi:hypothetical protein Osc7112_6851 (plasmid) [Oscillatoria nigro-viridis PCC 7112]|uniref:Uncharacterized protein n=1 Tax=Phormidium nigroviride PCC 7112 TaxID=179408 RepID=K9VTN8_9CYAN|nr:hypothetical protein Osc7112_6851 [Oscillatoria nigro-viridis PCC 7112]